jgi:hypothetical protein
MYHFNCLFLLTFCLWFHIMKEVTFAAPLFVVSLNMRWMTIGSGMTRTNKHSKSPRSTVKFTPFWPITIRDRWLFSKQPPYIHSTNGYSLCVTTAGCYSSVFLTLKKKSGSFVTSVLHVEAVRIRKVTVNFVCVVCRLCIEAESASWCAKLNIWLSLP